MATAIGGGAGFRPARSVRAPPTFPRTRAVHEQQGAVRSRALPDPGDLGTGEQIDRVSCHRRKARPQRPDARPEHPPARGVDLGREVGVAGPGVEEVTIRLVPGRLCHGGAHQPIDRLTQLPGPSKVALGDLWLVGHQVRCDHPAGEVRGRLQPLEAPPPTLADRGTERQAEPAHSEAEDQLPLGNHLEARCA